MTISTGGADPTSSSIHQVPMIAVLAHNVKPMHAGHLQFMELLENVGGPDQDAQRTAYWNDRVRSVKPGATGGVGDHAREYASSNWERTRSARGEKKAIHNNKCTFQAIVKKYSSAIMTTLTASTRCVVCKKEGHVIRAVPVCYITTWCQGDTLARAIPAALKDIIMEGHETCGCGGNARKHYKKLESRFANLLVVATDGQGSKHNPVEVLEVQPHGTYRLTGVGFCNVTTLAVADRAMAHWQCNFFVDDMWYHYDDTKTPAVKAVESCDYIEAGYKRSVYYYIQT